MSVVSESKAIKQSVNMAVEEMTLHVVYSER